MTARPITLALLGGLACTAWIAGSRASQPPTTVTTAPPAPPAAPPAASFAASSAASSAAPSHPASDPPAAAKSEAADAALLEFLGSVDSDDPTVNAYLSSNSDPRSGP